MTDTASFCLITEPWIACTLIDGTERLASLRDIFAGEVPIADIRGDGPTQDYAVFRTVLTVFWRAHAPEGLVGPGETFDPLDWFEDIWEQAHSGQPDTAALAYLDAHSDRFDLRHPRTPFMQVADLHTESGKTDPIRRIIPEAGSDFFTMRAGSGRESLTAAEAARWVIHAQAFDYSGIKSGAVGDPRVKGGKGYPIGAGWSGMTGGTIILGSTLRETLVLNTPPQVLTSTSEDLPAWEREPDGAAERASTAPKGAADLATWQSRRIRLHWEGDLAIAVLVSNGDQIPNAGANVLDDPSTPYRYSTNKSKRGSPVFYPRPFETERMLWRSLEPLLALHGDIGDLKRGEEPPKRPAVIDHVAQVREEILGAEADILEMRLISASYGSNASVDATTADARIGLPGSLVTIENSAARQTVFQSARATREAAKALGVFHADLREAAGGERAFGAAAMDGLLGELEGDFAAWLRRLQVDNLSQHVTAWHRHVNRQALAHAEQMLHGAGPRALIGREVTQGERSRLLSAGSAHQTLARKLRSVLDLSAPDQPAPSTPEEER